MPDLTVRLVEGLDLSEVKWDPESPPIDERILATLLANTAFQTIYAYYLDRFKIEPDEIAASLGEPIRWLYIHGQTEGVLEDIRVSFEVTHDVKGYRSRFDGLGQRLANAVADACLSVHLGVNVAVQLVGHKYYYASSRR